MARDISLLFAFSSNRCVAVISSSLACFVYCAHVDAPFRFVFERFRWKEKLNGVSLRLIDRSSWLKTICHRKIPWIVMRTERKENAIPPFSRSKRSIELNNFSADDFPNRLSKTTLKALVIQTLLKSDSLTSRKNHIINRLSSFCLQENRILVESERFRFWSFGKTFIKILEGEEKPKILIGSWPDKRNSETDLNE